MTTLLLVFRWTVVAFHGSNDSWFITCSSTFFLTQHHHNPHHKNKDKHSKNNHNSNNNNSKNYTLIANEQPSQEARLRGGSHYKAVRRRENLEFSVTTNFRNQLPSLAFETLADRRDKHILKFVKKCIEGKGPQFFSNYFKSNHDISKRITRQKHHLHLPRFRTECGKKSFKYQGCVIFNKFQSK